MSGGWDVRSWDYKPPVPEEKVQKKNYGPISYFLANGTENPYDIYVPPANKKTQSGGWQVQSILTPDDIGPQQAATPGVSNVSRHRRSRKSNTILTFGVQNSNTNTQNLIGV